MKNKSFLILILILSFFLPVKEVYAESYIISTDARVHNINSKNRSLARSSDGKLHCVYIRNLDRGVYYAYSTDEGATWTEEQIATNGTGQRNPAIATDSQDNLHVVWEGLGWGTNKTWPNIQYRKRTAAGWQAKEAVTDVSVEQRNPCIAIDSQDNVHVVWVWNTDFSCDQTGISYRKRTASGWQARENLTGTMERQSSPSMAIDSQNNIHVAWTDFDNIRYRKRTSSGWQARESVTNAAFNDLQVGVCIAIDSADNIQLVWSGEGWGTNKSYRNIQYRKRTAAGWGSHEQVTDVNFHQLHTNISIDAADNVHVVWDNDNASAYQYRKRTAAGWGNQEIIDNSMRDYFVNLIWAMHPTVSGNKPNVPDTGFALIYFSNQGLTFYKSNNLTWPGYTPPNTPATPGGPSTGLTGTLYSFSTSAIDPDGDQVQYRFDWGDGNISGYTSLVNSGSSQSISHSYANAGTYNIRAQAMDSHGLTSAWSAVHSLVITIPNQPPNTPSTPTGPATGLTGTSYSFSTSATDPDGDQVQYRFDWGDGNISGYTSLVNSGSSQSMSHSYASVNTYSIRAQAQDSNGLTSAWSTVHSIVITVPNQAPNTPSAPTGPSAGLTGTSYSFSTSATDPDGDQVQYRFDWGDGNISGYTSLVNSGSAASMTHSYATPNTYSIRAQAMDSKGATSGWSTAYSIVITSPTIPNQAPNTPSAPTGPSTGLTNTSYSFSTSATDPDGDQVQYRFDWGDGNISNYTPLVTSGDPASMSHSYATAGTYIIRALAMDSKEATSGWSAVHSIVISSPTISNQPPEITLLNSNQLTDGSGHVSIEITVNDSDQDACRIKIEYSINGANGPWHKAYLASVDSVSYGALPDLDNNSMYQIGTSSRILTNAGLNTITFTWDSKHDIGINYITTIRLRITPSDGISDGNSAVSSADFKVDNCIDIPMGRINSYGRGDGTITLSFGNPGSDAHFKEYKIFYNNMGSVSSSDTEWIDPCLSSVDYNGRQDITITGLDNNRAYYFNIWIYDDFGNSRNATEMRCGPAPDIIPEDVQIPDVTALQVSNNIIKAGINQPARIWCDVKIPGNLTLRIYGVKGEEIVTLFNGHKDAGRHAFTWSGIDSGQSKVGSGIYMVHMGTAGYNKTKKIAVIR